LWFSPFLIIFINFGQRVTMNQNILSEKLFSMMLDKIDFR